MIYCQYLPWCQQLVLGPVPDLDPVMTRLSVWGTEHAELLYEPELDWTGGLCLEKGSDYTLKKTCNFYGQITATLMPVVDRNNYG